MLGDERPFTDVPYFWTNQGGKGLDYAGYGPDWERIETRGDVAKLDFISYYIRGGKAVAACALERKRELIHFLDRLAAEGPPSAASLV